MWPLSLGPSVGGLVFAVGAADNGEGLGGIYTSVPSASCPASNLTCLPPAAPFDMVGGCHVHRRASLEKDVGESQEREASRDRGGESEGHPRGLRGSPLMLPADLGPRLLLLHGLLGPCRGPGQQCHRLLEEGLGWDPREIPVSSNNPRPKGTQEKWKGTPASFRPKGTMLSMAVSAFHWCWVCR